MTRLTRRTTLTLALVGLATATLAAEPPLRVGTSAGPYAEILDHVVPLAKAQGLDIKVTEFNDYTIPNEALFRGDLDVSNFQHRPYLENANRTRGVRLDQARNLLEATDRALKTVAFDCGFAGPEQMRAVFQRRLGVSPQRYRESFQTPRHS